MSNETTRHSGLRRWGKRLLWLISGIGMLLLLLRLSLKTPFVHNWVKNTVVSTVNSQIDGSFNINNLSGDLWHEASISGISLTQQGSTLASIDSVHTRYNIWALLEGKVAVSEIRIYRPHTNIRRVGDRWNIQRLAAGPPETGTSGEMIPFRIGNVVLQNGSVSIVSDSLPGDSLGITDLSVISSLAYEDESFSLNVRDLSFDIHQQKLEEPLHVESSASAQNSRLTLSKLVLATGNSMLRSSAYLNLQDSTARFDLSVSPLSWKDITNFTQHVPLRQNIQFNMALEGTPEQFELSLSMQAAGLESFRMSSRMQWSDGLIVNKVETELQHFNGSVLFADTTLPVVEHFKADFAGNIALADYRKGYGDLSFSAGPMHYASYSVDEISGSGSLNGTRATVDITAHKNEQNLAADISLAQLWTELPSVEAKIKGDRIDPGYWVQDTTYSGSLSFQSGITGQGWYPGEHRWSYSLNMGKSQLMGKSVRALTAKGQISASAASLDGRLQMEEGVFEFFTNINNLNRTPSYNYRLQSRDFDIASLMGQPDFETALNIDISGQGRGIDVTDMRLTSSVVVDSSLINGELLRNFRADVHLEDTVAVVENGRLQSTIAEGSFDGRMHLLKWYADQNELSLDLLFKDIGALAPLVDVGELAANGTISGKLQPAEENDLQFRGAFDFSDIKYGESFSADRAQGSVDTHIRRNLEYMADFDLRAPTFSGVNIQDLNFKTTGSYGDSTATGSFELNFSSSTEGRIEQGGTYTVNEDSVRIRTSEYKIISEYRVLSLEDPFDLVIRDQSMRMDTMRVSSGDGAFLEMAVPLINASEQQVMVKGEALNLEVIQSCLLGETYVKGMLSGGMEIIRKDTTMRAEGQLLLSNVGYKQTRFDTLLVESHIAGERMEGMLSVRHEGQELIFGTANLPFRLGDPQNLPPTFFEEPVSGRISIYNISIDRFKSIFAEVGIMNTTGIFSFRGSLSGQAGSPRFTADATISEASLSGVSVDSVTAGLTYDHEEAELTLDGSVISLRQKAAEITASVPLYINMKTFRLDLPQKGDSIAVDITTNNFDLAALNDFLDRQTLRSVAGHLNGNVQIAGPLGNLETDGLLKLGKGTFRLVPAGITVNNITSALQFDADRLRLTEFSAQSGKGSATANGEIKLQSITPGAIDVKIKARNFRIANTSEYNAVINTNMNAAGSITQPKVTGNISFIRGFLQLQNFGEKSVENVQLDSVEQQGFDVNIYDSLALDMDVSFNRRFYIRNQRYLEMEVELDGGVDLIKSPGNDLELFGTINAPSGYARPFGKRFNLQEGIVVFSGDPTNPRLQIRTRYEPLQTKEDIVIWYIIEGTVEDPKFKYESQPPMELENIISYTLFGQPFYALDSWKQVVANSGGGASTTNVALDVLLDRVEALATQKLGIDVVRIDNTRSGGEHGTAITTGWYLNPRVFFAIQNVITGSTPDTSFILEYLLKKNLKLMIRQGNGIRQGVDLKWNYEY